MKIEGRTNQFVEVSPGEIDRRIARFMVRLSLIFFLASFRLSAFAQGTAFTYQGKLTDQDNPANGLYDFQFVILDASTLGNKVGSIVNAEDVAVTNGLFTYVIDPGPSVFTGPPRWLEIGVRPGASNGLYTPVLPRQPLLPSPYAMLAEAISGSINGGQIIDNSLSGSKLADNAVTTTKLNDLSVTTSKLANSAVTSVKIASGAVGSTQLAANSVSGPKIVDGSITPVDLDVVSFSTTFWQTLGNGGTTAGTHFLGTTDNQALELKVNNQRMLRLEPNTNVIGGFSGNIVSNTVVGGTIAGGGERTFTNRVLGDFGTVSGGKANTASATATVGGGLNNFASGGRSTIAGGENNQASGTTSTIGGGYANHATAFRANISGGELNTASAPSATIAGGDNNSASGFAAAIGGGEFNNANGQHATIPGGSHNTATNYSFAAGRQAKAIHEGSFVWADNKIADFASKADNQFLIRADFTGINRADQISSFEYFGLRAPVTNEFGGMYVETAGTGKPFYGYAEAGIERAWSYVDGTDGNKWKLNVNNSDRITVTAAGFVGIGVNNPTNKLHVAGGVSATAFVNTSDRNAKENFTPVSPREVLAKVASLPITTWNFKELHDGRHMGPMAQDFYAAFGLGGSDTTITTLDPDGVTLAAIQGLNQKLDEQLSAKTARITELESRNATLEKRLAQIEKLLAQPQSAK